MGCGGTARDGDKRASILAGRRLMGPKRRLSTCSLYQKFPPKSSQYSTLRPTYWDSNLTSEQLGAVAFRGP